MIQLILILAFGALCLSSLYFLARRTPRAEGGSGPLVEARQALQALRSGLLPPELIARIFARADLEYVLSEVPENVRPLFMEERKKIALSWVNQVRRQILLLRRFYLGSARSYARLSFRTEIALALDFAALLFACRALQVALYVRGPFAVPGMVETTAAVAARVCKVYEESLAFLSPAQLGALADRSAGAARL
ncbi:MAG TPA: hypothetical protein VN822_10215 [Candidatus Acidoferrales bacterium]|nr:hypothetical protein [Candidatus Acidoferrales bacterium]